MTNQALCKDLPEGFAYSRAVALSKIIIIIEQVLQDLICVEEASHVPEILLSGQEMQVQENREFTARQVGGQLLLKCPGKPSCEGQGRA